MPKFQRKPEIVTAVQWFKLGDHPDVDEHGKDFTVFRCSKCGKSLEKEHGWLWAKKGGPVCPGDWIIQDSTGRHVVSDAEFRGMYEPLIENNTENKNNIILGTSVFVSPLPDTTKIRKNLLNRYRVAE
jgi:hypothetical protein